MTACLLSGSPGAENKPVESSTASPRASAYLVGRIFRSCLRRRSPTVSTTESWLPVADYEDLYSVSSFGRVRSEERIIDYGKGRVQHRAAKILKSSPNKDGYPIVTLHRDKVGINCYVHDLVIQAFRGDKPAGLQVRHLDDNKRNCAIHNLVFGTKSDNQYDAVRNGIHPMAKRSHCKNGHPFDDDNVRRYPRQPGTRVCLACRREHKARQRQQGVAA